MSEAHPHDKGLAHGKAAGPAVPSGGGAAPGQRQLLQAIVIALFAGGVWFGAVRPMESKLAAKNAELRALSGGLAEFESGVAQEEPLARAIDDMTGQARRINAWTAGSGDATRLYEAFRTIASKCSVRIERVEPSAPSRSSRSAGSKAGPASELFGYNVEVTGTYQSVGCFMDAVERELGATKIVSFHMSPCGAMTSGLANSPTDPLITAILETSHLRLAIPGVDAAKAAPLAQGGGS
jgi:hypothetical protein